MKLRRCHSSSSGSITSVRFASKFVFYNGRAEADTMWTAVRMVQGQLAEAGFAPR